MNCENDASVTVINTGRSKDLFLQAFLRELVLIAAKHNFEIRTTHISGISNRIPVELSKWSLGKIHQDRFKDLVPQRQIKDNFI